MTRKWSGFVPQNLSIKEEWQLLEACHARARPEGESPTAEDFQPVTIRRGPDGVPVPIQKPRKHARRR